MKTVFSRLRRINFKIRRFYFDVASFLLVLFLSYFITEFITQHLTIEYPNVKIGAIFVALYIITSLSLFMVIYIFINVAWLIVDRLRGITGARFRLKVFLFFVIVTLIPTVLLWFYLSPYFRLLSTNFFTKNLFSAIKASEDISKMYLDHFYWRVVRNASRDISKHQDIHDCLAGYRHDSNFIHSILRQRLSDYNIDLLVLFDAKRRPIGITYLKKKLGIVDISELQDFYSEDHHRWEVIRSTFSLPYMDQEDNLIYNIFFAPYPIYRYVTKNGRRTRQRTGLILTGRMVNKSLLTKIQSIKLARAKWVEAKAIVHGPFKNFGWIVILLTFPIILFSIWLGQRFSRGITETINRLLDGTKRISAGDLDFRIEHQTNDELAILVNAFNNMARELKDNRIELIYAQKISAWREVARRLTHEINNPLTPIRLSAERLLRKYSGEDQAYRDVLEKCVKQIIFEVESIHQLTQEFSQFARMPHFKPGPVDLNEVVSNALDPFIGQKGQVTFHVHLAQNMHIEGDKNQISQILLNLVQNALQAVAETEHPRIEIRTQPLKDLRGEFVVLEVEDNGCGINPDVLEKIYDPYFTTKKDGTGLGLSIVHRIVTDHNARIKFDSRPGRGTCVIIEFKKSHLGQKNDHQNIDY